MRLINVVHVLLVVFALCSWTPKQALCDANVENAENSPNSEDDDAKNSPPKLLIRVESDEDAYEDADTHRNNNNNTRPNAHSGLHRRLSNGSSPRRDSQLLSVLAARRKQLLTDRVGTHSPVFTFKPERSNITNAYLEIRDANSTVIKRINLSENRSLLSGESRSDLIGHLSKVPLRTESVATKLISPSADKSSETKPGLSLKTFQDAKVNRAAILNRRKPVSEVVRFGQGTRKPLIDFSVVSHETLGIPEYKKDVAGAKLDEIDVILDPEEEFQVDESNHGLYLYNYSTNGTSAINPNESISTPITEIELLNLSLSTKPSLVEELSISHAEEIKNTKVMPEVKSKNVTLNETKSFEEKLNKTTKEETVSKSKSEIPLNKDNESNKTLFLTDELYNHFRPLESELPVEDMAPFLFFGQKITINIPKDNVTQLQLTPTKPTYFIRQPDKKRGSYRPVTEKNSNVSEENEDEINENMDVAVVKNVIEKNKVRNTIKMQAPSRQNLASAYRRQVNEITSPIPTTVQTKLENYTLNEDSNLPNNGTKDVDKLPINATRAANRTYFNFRRKPIKLVMLNETAAEKEVTSTTTVPPVPQSTVVYTAVVTSVSITSSVKAQNKTDTNDTIDLPVIDNIANFTNIAAKLTNSSSEDLTTVESINGLAERFNNVSNDIRNEGKKRNETLAKVSNKKKPETRHRLPTSRPRVRFGAPSKVSIDPINPAPSTPLVLYSNRSRTPQSLIKYKSLISTERSLPTEASVNSSLATNASSVINSNKTEKSVDTKDCSNSTCYKNEINTTKILKLDESIDSSKNIDETNLNTTSNNSKDIHIYTNYPISDTVNVTVKINEAKEDKKSERSNPDAKVSDSRISTDNQKDLLERRNNEVLIEAEKTSMTTYILAGLGFLPLTLIVLFVLKHLFTKKTKDIDADYEGYFQDDIKKENQVTTVARPSLPSPKKPDQKWEFPRNKLRLQTLLGQGNFGQVWKAEADDLTGHDGLTRLVAVKTIKETASQKEKQELLHEICIMQKIGTHPNVVTLLACCTEQEPYLLIMEYVMCGKLLTYLRDRRTRVDRFQMPRGGLTSRDLTVFAYCVARGMDYLASKGIVHRDLAARNVLVDHNKLCKIADFGMSRDVTSTSEDKFNKPQRNALPVRWMAPEALLYSVYSHETDVWAYGVLLWEIVTLGSTPYAAMSGREVLSMVTEGYRLERPAHCKPHLYQTMHACWHADPTQRPPFSDIKKQLSELLENEPTEGHYVDLDSFYQDSSVYSDPSAIIENDGGISIEYSGELNSKLSKDDIPRRSFHIPNATSLQRNFSGGNSLMKNFSTVRTGNHTSVGGFGIMDGGFSGRDGNFCDRNMDKLSGASFHRERDKSSSRENLHTSNSLIARNSFNGITNQANWVGLGGRPFLMKSGSSRSKRISEFECNI